MNLNIMIIYNALVNKFLNRAIEFQTRNLKNLQGSGFHCSTYIKKLTYEKHLFNKRIKIIFF